MFFRNVRSAADLTLCCKPVFFQKSFTKLGYVRLQLRNSFHNSRRGVRRPITEPNPLENIQIQGPLHASGLLKPFFFTIGVTSLSLAGCVIWEYENLRSHANSFLKRPGKWVNSHQKRLLAQYKSEPGPLKKWWISLRESEKVFYPILAANVLVFGAWRIRSLQPLMIKYFCSNPSGRAKCLPMVLSTFSHYSTLHLAANMYVLYSFMPAAVASLGKEQFVAMYLSAGVISSFASFLYKVLLSQPGLSLGALAMKVKQTFAKQNLYCMQLLKFGGFNGEEAYLHYKNISGAIMSVLSYVCMQYPDTKLSIIFLPMYTFAAGTAIKVIMSVDLAGVIMGWKFFDHAAHLGGAVFGMAWCYWGNLHVWGNRDKFLQYYHSIRKDS